MVIIYVCCNLTSYTSAKSVRMNCDVMVPLYKMAFERDENKLKGRASICGVLFLRLRSVRVHDYMVKQLSVRGGCLGS